MATMMERITAAARMLMGKEVAPPKEGTARNVWGTSQVASRLTPERLATLLTNARDGNLDDYLELAEEMEERDLVYRTVLNTRKLALQGLDVRVRPGDDTPAAAELAEAVMRDVVDRPGFTTLLYDLMDGVAKGWSTVEIEWSSAEQPLRWVPGRYEWRDPRWFEWDRDTGRRLLLRNANGVAEEPPDNRMIIHVPRTKSGVPARGGIALPVAYYHMIKSYDVASWTAFIDVYGFPMRVGKFSKDATVDDIEVLKKAVANIGRDVGAVIPDDMILDIVAGVVPGAATDYFKDLADWADNQVVLGVLGQNATTLGTQGKLGSEEARERVLHDILRADARQIGETLTRDLARPYAMLNRGPAVAAPRVELIVEPHEDLETLVKAVAQLVPLGFRVGTADLYPRLRLAPPEDDAEVLTSPAAAPVAGGRPGRPGEGLNSPRPRSIGEMRELLDDERWEPVLRPVHGRIAELVADAGSFEELERRLPELLQGLNANQVARLVAAATMKARGLGDRDFED